MVVALVDVSEREQLLITNENLVPNRKVALPLMREFRSPNPKVDVREVNCCAHEVGRGPICSGTVRGASGSSDFRPEQAWQRAQPALAVPEFMPRSVIYA